MFISFHFSPLNTFILDDLVSFRFITLHFYFILLYFYIFFFRVTCEPFVKGGELNKSDREE